MTENKRFELIPMGTKHDIWYGLFDNLEKEYVTDKLWGGSGKVCDKLNELVDENEQLQFKLKECNDNKLFSRRELEKENKRIKQIIKEAYETERTAIGKNVLKQLLDNI